MSEKKEYYHAYDERYKRAHDQNIFWGDPAFSSEIESVMKTCFITKQDSILEIGCGEGINAVHLLNKGYQHLCAVDCSKEAIDTCKKRADNYKDHFKVLDVIAEKLDEKFDFIYSIGVLHMLVLDEHRKSFYEFINEHLKYEGKALIIIQGDGEREYSSDIENAFDLQKRKHIPSNKEILVPGTSYRAVSFKQFNKELKENHFRVIDQRLSEDIPGYAVCMVCVVEREKEKREFFDAVDQFGNLLGIDMERGIPHDKSLYHQVVEIITVNERNEILITQRHPEKRFGLKWECTCGSVVKGETVIQGALRELKEETGISVCESDLKIIAHDIYEDALYSIFICHLANNKCSVTLQDRETIAYKWIDKGNFFELLKQDEFTFHQKERLLKVFKMI